MGFLDRIDAGKALAYAQSLEPAEGGFRGGLWDDRTDVEYTFYGLGVVALLSLLGWRLLGDHAVARTQILLRRWSRQ